MTDPVVTMTAISKSFPGVRALDGVDFRLLPGEVHALMGENGAGKSTLIKVLTGVYGIDAGIVTLGGEQVAFTGPMQAAAAGVSTVYQEINLLPNLSVAENVFIGREPRRFGAVRWGEMRRQARALLARLDLSIDVAAPLSTYSLAVQQMIAIARAIDVQARVLILDEPTSSLDATEVTQLFKIMSQLRDDGIAILFVTHFLDQVYRIADRITVLRNGRLVGEYLTTDLPQLALIEKMIGKELDVLERIEEQQPKRTARQGGTPFLQATELGRKRSVEPFSLTIHQGEVVGLAGLLGSGRTETAKAVFGVEALDAGTISVDGSPARRWNPAAAIRSGIGMVPEDRKAEGIVPGLSVRDNIVLAALPRLARAGFVSDRRCDEIVDVFVRRLRIKIASPDQPVRDLSGGNQQKVLLARMLCLHPRVLLLDEPTRGIDVGAKAEIQALIDELARNGLGVVLISSELEEVVEGSHRVLVLRDGAVVGVLTGDEISEHRIMTTIAGAASDG